jgi:AAA domain
MRETLRDYMKINVVLPAPRELAAPPEYVSLGLRATREHPFIEALGGYILDVSKFAEKLTARLPLAPEGGSVVQANPVLMAIELYELYMAAYPTPMLERLHQRILEILSTGYLPRNPLDEVATARVVHMLTSTPPKELCNRLEQMAVVNPPSILVIGASGMGKSFGCSTVLTGIPQVWQHQEYKGHAFKQVQIVWLSVECPSTGTLRVLLLSILLQIDLLLGTEHYLRWLNSKEPVDVLIVSVAVILYVNGVGCIVLDELQHLKTRGYKETETMMNFFVSLMNFLCVPIVSIGTYSAVKVLTGVMRDARRLSASGTMDFRRYEWSDPATKSLQDYYFGFLPGQDKRPLTPDDHLRLYDIYQGFHFLLPNLVHRCTTEVSLRGLKFVTPEVLEYYAKEELKPIARALDAVRNADPDAISQYDDLISPDAIKALFEAQKRRHGETTGAIQEIREPVSPRPELEGPFHREFAHIDFTAEEIAHYCAETKLRFGEGDVYPNLKARGLIATALPLGQFGPLQA